MIMVGRIGGGASWVWGRGDKVEARSTDSVIKAIPIVFTAPNVTLTWVVNVLLLAKLLRKKKTFQATESTAFWPALSWDGCFSWSAREFPVLHRTAQTKLFFDSWKRRVHKTKSTNWSFTKSSFHKMVICWSTWIFEYELCRCSNSGPRINGFRTGFEKSACNIKFWVWDLYRPAPQSSKVVRKEEIFHYLNH